MWVPVGTSGFVDSSLNHDSGNVCVPKQWPYWARKYGLRPASGRRGRKRWGILRITDEGLGIRIVFRVTPSGTILFLLSNPIISQFGNYEVLGPIPQTEAEFKMMLFLAKI
jgi:hypothetical protein